MPLPLLLYAAVGLQAGSSILGGIASKKANQAAARAAQLNALAAKISTAFKVQDIRDAGARLESSQRAAYGRSGVEMSSGSPAEVIMGSARNIEKEIFRATYTGSLQEQGAMSSADAYKKAGDYALLGGFAKAGASVLGGMDAIDRLKVPGNTPKVELMSGDQLGTWP